MTTGNMLVGAHKWQIRYPGSAASSCLCSWALIKVCHGVMGWLGTQCMCLSLWRGELHMDTVQFLVDRRCLIKKSMVSEDAVAVAVEN